MAITACSISLWFFFSSTENSSSSSLFVVIYLSLLMYILLLLFPMEIVAIERFVKYMVKAPKLPAHWFPRIARNEEMVWKMECITFTSWYINRLVHRWGIFSMPMYHNLEKIWGCFTNYIMYVASNYKIVFFLETEKPHSLMHARVHPFVCHL